MKEKNIKIAVIGGDLRQLYIAKELAELGYSVQVFGIEIQHLEGGENFSRAKTLTQAADEAFIMILPLPFSRDKVTLNAPFSASKIALSDVFSASQKIPYIAVGLIDESQRKAFSESSSVIDYAVGEEFALKNAYATVEAAMSIAIREIPITLRGAHCAITGYGRIGKLLVRALILAGAEVKVFARKALDRVSAELEGARAYDVSKIAENISGTDILINTVPSVIIDERALDVLPVRSTVIELASAPGGLSKKYAEERGIHYVNAQSLPGKYSPISAAKTIVESIFSALSEMEAEI